VGATLADCETFNSRHEEALETTQHGFIENKNKPEASNVPINQPDSPQETFFVVGRHLDIVAALVERKIARHHPGKKDLGAKFL
jgi:hypothetical protein